MTFTYQTEVSQSGLFFRQAEKYNNDVFMRAKLKNGEPTGSWVDVTWREAAKNVRELGAGLIEMGINKTDCVAIFAHNRPRWIISEQAIQGAGAISVPIYPTSTDSQLSFILNDCKAKALITGDRELLAQAARIKNDVPTLLFIGCMTSTGETKDNTIIGYDALLEKGASSATAMEAFEKRRKEIAIDDPASIIYTSGTTGNPKGVVITQSNFKAQTDILLSTPIPRKMLERDTRLECLCFLPLCHILGRTTDYHAQIALGAIISFAEDMKKIRENLLEIRPQILFSVPRLYEKIYEAVQVHTRNMTGIKKKIFDWSINAGGDAADYMIEGKSLPLTVSIKFALANLLVFDAIRKIIGFDRLITAASGGGALSADIAKFFRSMNITVTEGYGLTETTSAACWNGPRFLDPLPETWLHQKAYDYLYDAVVEMQSTGKTPFKSLKGFFKLLIGSKIILPRFIIKPGVVGRPVKGTEIRIAEDGEVLIKGPQVFKREHGYFNQVAKTDEVFTEDGFFKTGDIGEFDENGFLKITDRKKELIVTSGGKNIAPHPIELALSMEMYIDQACVIGDGKNYISALIVPQFKLLEKMARSKNIFYKDHKDLVNHPEIIKFYDEIVGNVNSKLARYEQVKRFRLLSTTFSEQTGELTPTQKMKRKVITKNFQNEIESLYTLN